MNLLKPQIAIRSANLDDRQRLANLIHFETHVHRHLDWRAPLDWIGYPPYLVLEQRKSLLAALACSPDPPEVAWLRLFAVNGAFSRERAWEMLWGEALQQLQSQAIVSWAVALSLWPWFSELLASSGFSEDNQVVMLNWTAGSLQQEQPPTGVVVRPMSLDDIGAVEAVDAVAFAPLWRNSRASLELAYRQAILASVAVMDGQIVGYQISTATPVGGHLARLAVLPHLQGQGIGSQLLNDLLQQFKRRNAQKITVNTQRDNGASLRLYQKAGFYLTGESYPVFIYPLA